MATYLVQVAFTADSIKALVEKPENRLSTMIPLVQKMGGKFIGSWLSFGRFDSTAIIEMPDNISIKAFEMMCMSGGGLRFFEATPLISFEDGVEAMRLAGSHTYQRFGEN
ncbi:GYD domain-containing protein [Rhodobacteraceae bacterium RKSG542]|uniref:GYD domain-containing protein n=1 Tax=Pseudovibrio flavus TaxID=2529854 RepID=UPI0012BC8AF8|nr:GYD domain-containing protein [Pseudovibrio flavus]MTI18059.1 GYD domain-containing protein [Pseudovibrio flavus]